MSERGPGVLRLAGFQRVVADVERAVDFYVGALGFVADPATGDHRRLVLGEQSIDLVAGEAMNPSAAFDVAFQHIAIVASDMDAALQRLHHYAPQPISRDGAVLLPPEAGGVTAFKFRDPDGHALELIHFPPGVADPRWQRAGAPGPTLGFDHSAIGVGDVERSIAFYAGILGLVVSSRHVNRGPAQGRLDGLDESMVEVVGLAPRAQPTPHLELLGYRVPRPVAGDVERDEITFEVEDLEGIVRRLGIERVERVVTLRDDDGHRLRLVQAD